MAFPKRKNLQEQQRNQLVIIGSKNPVKILCTEEAFHLTYGDGFLVQGLNVDSGVGNQPYSDVETYEGAFNRANNCKLAFPEADFWVGIEGGVSAMGEDLTSFAWIVILDKTGKIGRAKTGSFFLPQGVADLLKGGMELGDADDQVFSSSNSKQKGGAVGLLTKGIVDRRDLYRQAVVLALIPFTNPDLYDLNSNDR